jgi:acyl-CoA synthetase (AMP-forming)/AMP-acid ligase II
VLVVQDRERWEGTMAGHSGSTPRLDAELPLSPTGDGDLDAGLADASPDAMAVLQYTSGSTAAPRGVVLSHRNLVANCDAGGRAAGLSPNDRMVSWLPLHHDMGLIAGLLVNLYWRMPTHVMSPLTFLMRPAWWLRAIHEYGATVSVGPTFAYDLCARAIAPSQIEGVDLSRWRLAFIGAETVDPRTLVAFADRFRAQGFGPRAFFPVYGLAEATLAVSFPRPESEVVIDSVDRTILASTGHATPIPPGEGAVRFASVGAALPGHRIAIVSAESGEALGERQLGEVVVAGPSLSARYFHEPADTGRTELRTGDLGYVADGRLYIVDRIKDVVIVAGQNYSAPDIEAAVSDVTGLRPGRTVAFAAPGQEGTEDLWIVVETDGRSKRPLGELEREIEQKVLRRIGVAPRHVVLVPKGAIELTTSGKLCRGRCRDRILRMYAAQAAARTRVESNPGTPSWPPSARGR